MAIGRELAVQFVELRLEERHGVAATLRGKHPKIALSLWGSLGVYDVPAVARPLTRSNRSIVRQQQFLWRVPVEGFLVDVERLAAAIRAENDAVAATRPKGRTIGGWIAGESPLRPP